MEIAKKLHIKSGSVFVKNAREGFVLDLPEAAHRVDTADGTRMTSRNSGGSPPRFPTSAIYK